MKQTFCAFVTGWNAGDWYTDKKGQAFIILEEDDNNYRTAFGNIYKHNAQKVTLREHNKKIYAVPFDLFPTDPENGIEKGIWKEVSFPPAYVRYEGDPLGFPSHEAAFALDEAGQFKDGDFKNLDDRIKKYNNIFPVVPDFVTKKVINFTVEDSVPNKGLKVLVVHLQDGSKFVVGGDRYNPSYLVPYANAFDVQPAESHCAAGNGSYNHGKTNPNE